MKDWIPVISAVLVIVLPKIIEFFEGGSVRKSLARDRQESRRFRITLFLFNKKAHPEFIGELDWKNMLLLCEEYIKEHERFPDIDGLAEEAAKEIIKEAKEKLL